MQKFDHFCYTDKRALATKIVKAECVDYEDFVEYNLQGRARVNYHRLTLFLPTFGATYPLECVSPPQYPNARFGELTKSCPTSPGLRTGSPSLFKMYACEL